MDEQQQQRLNQAAEEFTDALVQSFRAASERGVDAQEQNAQLMQDFFDRVNENLRAQAEGTRQLGQQLADQQQRATEAGQQLTQESVNAYMDLVNSMFSFGRQSAREVESSTGEAQRTAREAERDATTTEAEEEGSSEEITSVVRESVRRSGEGSRDEAPQDATTTDLGKSGADAEGLPLEDYDSLTVQQVTQRLGQLSVEEIEQLRDYEADNRNRRSLMERFERRIS